MKQEVSTLLSSDFKAEMKQMWQKEIKHFFCTVAQSLATGKPNGFEIINLMIPQK